MRLDKYLTNKYPSLSRVYIKAQIKLGNFLVNGKIAKSFYVLQADDLVSMAPGFVMPDATGIRIAPNPDIKLDTIYEDDNVLVINKPAGLSVHPRQDKNSRPILSEINSTLVSGLLAYYPAIANVGDPSASSGQAPSAHSANAQGELDSGQAPLLRPGLVHRLDKDTSGVMIIAKNQSSFDWLKKQFKERLTAKKYIALVHGSLKEKQGEIKTLLARATENPTKQKITKHEGKEAVTQYKVIQEFKDYSLIEARPKTGRLHQIRVHLAHIGHPVAGDIKYGNAHLTKLPCLTRQFLHAQELHITLPDNQEKIFQAPLPTELNNVIEKLN